MAKAVVRSGYAAPKYASERRCGVVEVVGRPLIADPATVEHVGVVGDGRLRWAFCSMSRTDARPHASPRWPRTRCPPPRGQAQRRLVEDQQPRVGHQRPRHREQCCWPPLSVPAGLRPPLAEDREHACQSSARAARAALSRVNPPSIRFSCTVSSRKIRRPSGQQATPRTEPAVRRQRVHDRSGHPHLAGGHGQQAGDGPGHRRLSRAVGPEHRDHLTGMHPEAHAVERDRLAVPGGDVGQLQQRRLGGRSVRCAPAPQGGVALAEIDLAHRRVAAEPPRGCHGRRPCPSRARSPAGRARG